MGQNHFDNNHSSHSQNPAQLHPNSPAFLQMGHKINDPAEELIISSIDQERAFRSAIRHTRRVKWLKFGLPLAAIIIVAGFVGWVAKQKPVMPPINIAEGKKFLQQDELIMQNPTLNGFTDGRAYQLDADRAIQKVATPDIIDLEGLSARITDEKDQWVTITSLYGRYNQTNEWLDLTGKVDLKSSLGYTLKTELVNVQMKPGYMRTRSPVDIQSKDIILKSDWLEAHNNGEVIRFIGKVSLRIDPALINKSEKESAKP